MDAVTLPTNGTYTVLIDPTLTDLGSAAVEVLNVPADASGTVSVGGSPATLTTTVPGQNGSVTFSGTAGQQVTVHAAGSTTGGVTVSLRGPDGAMLTSSYQAVSSFDLSQQTLPATGTYTIFVDPAGSNTGSISISVTSP